MEIIFSLVHSFSSASNGFKTAMRDVFCSVLDSFRGSGTVREMWFLFVFLFLSFCGCQKSPPTTSSQTFRLNIALEPCSLDPRKLRDAGSSTIARMLFEGLTRVSLGGEIELALAKEIEVSEDGRVYVFHLRDSYWSNGDPVTAFDFAKSWQTILDPKFPTDIAYQLYPIRNARKAKRGEVEMGEVGIRAIDPFTLEVSLESPVPYFLGLLSLPCFFPMNSQWTEKNFICNGPFFLKTWNHADRLSLVKNSYYWETGTVKLDRVDLFVVGNDTGLRMFEEGKLDWTGSPLATLPVDAVKELKEKQELQVSPFLATYFLRANTSEEIKGKKNPLASSAFRRALAMSIDRKAIVEHLLQGGQKEAKCLVPPEMGLSEEGDFSTEALGLPQIDVPIEPIVLSYNNSSERNGAIAQALQKQWEEQLGIAVAIEAVEPKVYFQRVSTMDFQLAAGSWTADFNDPINFLEVFKYKDGGTNNTGWENAQYIDLLNRSQLCRDLEERKQLLRAAEKILMEEMPLIPIYHFALNYLKKPELEGVVLSPLGQLDLRWAHREVDHPSPSKR